MPEVSMLACRMFETHRALALVGAAALLACGTSEPTKSNPPSSSAVATCTSTAACGGDLTGTWKIDTVCGGQQPDWTACMCNGHGTETSDETGTWSTTGNTLTTGVLDGGDVQTVDYCVVGDTVRISVAEGLAVIAKKM